MFLTPPKGREGAGQPRRKDGLQDGGDEEAGGLGQDGRGVT